MEKTIRSIFEIDKQANVIINKANEEKLRLKQEYEAKADMMEQEIMADNNVRIKELRAKIDNELEDELKKLKEKCEMQQKQLEEAYATNHEAIADRIFQDIIKL